MDENHQNGTGNKLAATDDVNWVTSKKSGLWIPKHVKQKEVNSGRWGFSSRNLWDWLNLIGVIAIPIVIAAGTLYYTQQQAQLSAMASDKQHQTDIQIAQDQEHENTLQTYLDRMSTLLLNDKLLQSKPKDELRQLARAQTLAALRGLDPQRKGILLQFLSDARLISRGDPIIDLANADFSSADLRGAYLEETNLRKVNLVNADLSGAYLSIAELTEANLLSANLSYADLSGADLDHATLKHANMVRAFVAGGNVNYANLSYANLTGTSLNDEGLVGTNLNYAILSGAILDDSNLYQAIVTQRQLSLVKSLKNTTMPDGSTHP